MTRWISEAEVASLVGVADAVAVVEELLRATAEGLAECRPRQRVRVPGAMLHGLIGGCAYLNRVGWKQYLTTRQGAQFLVGLYDTEDPQLLALIEADRLGQLRTGAITGLAVRQLYGQPISRLALFGCGWQAESQLEAICHANRVAEASVYCRNPERRQRFAAAMQPRIGCKIEAAPDARSAATGADVVVCITTSSEPVVENAWLEECRLLVAAGSNAENRIEFPPSLVARASQVVCDDIPSCRIEAGELIAAEREGIFRFEQAVRLADYFAPQQIAAAEGLRIFKSVGIASADVAMADRIYHRATENSDSSTAGG
ncbi:ornithine cyclodeaminase family protein [Candidatus Laterigemmans baculatus]|uniref:ornithine cyclodeaminase family protein n=1 Tax=Candidatus Laterigemmans baculatus TaxID=2770505 RepID=UPI0013DB7CAF|nr:ornithine cyclodeaminase family protein [Candidatus Laterigemmans baculatus]